MDPFFAGMANGTPQTLLSCAHRLRPRQTKPRRSRTTSTWATPDQLTVSASNLPNEGGVSVNPFVDGQRAYTGGGPAKDGQNLWNTPYPRVSFNQLDINFGFSIDRVNENLHAFFQQHGQQFRGIDDGIPSRPIVALETAPQIADAQRSTFRSKSREKG